MGRLGACGPSRCCGGARQRPAMPDRTSRLLPRSPPAPRRPVPRRRAPPRWSARAPPGPPGVRRPARPSPGRPRAPGPTHRRPFLRLRIVRGVPSRRRGSPRIRPSVPRVRSPALGLPALVEAPDLGVPRAAGLGWLAWWLLGYARDLLRPDRDAGEGLARGVAEGRDDGRGRGDRWRLADALEAVGGFGVRELQDLHPNGGHVQDGGEEVVRKRGVLDLAVLYLDLLQQSQTETLRYAALDLALQCLRVHDLPDVLGRRDLHDAHQPEVHVHLHDGPVGREGELQVSVALPVLVQRVRLPVMELQGLLELLVPDQVNQGDDGPTVGEDRIAVQGEVPAELFPD